MDPLRGIRPIPIRTVVHPCLPSTYLWMRAHRHEYCVPTLCIAQKQTEGIGQRGSTWLSLPGDATFSLYLPGLNLPAAGFFTLSQVAALAVSLWLCRQGLDAQIKWPNDILVDGRKIAGILIETFASGRHIHGATIGIGLNLARRTPGQMQFPYPITTAANEGVLAPSACACALRIAQIILSLQCASLRSSMHRIPFLYHQMLYRRHQPTQFCDAGEIFEGRISHVAPDGRLCILDARGRQRLYAFKEVQMLHRHATLSSA